MTAQPDEWVSDDVRVSHRVMEEWRGVRVKTLEDLLRPGLRAVCVGINPTPDSVAAGHYYQGKLGQAFFKRLRRAGLLPPKNGPEDDAALSAGIGFTDIVKRPTRNASELGREELEYGRSLLLAKLEPVQADVVIFTFKKTATVIFGRFSGFGFIGKKLAGAEVFVMPGPFERADRADAALAKFRAWWTAAAVGSVPP